MRDAYGWGYLATVIVAAGIAFVSLVLVTVAVIWGAS